MNWFLQKLLLEPIRLPDFSPYFHPWVSNNSLCFFISDERVKQQKTVVERWEESLLACTSFSQVFVHLNTLDQSITWSKSVLNARCRLCRRKGDAEHMLLCDGCDRGHHMYCIKPPITEVKLTFQRTFEETKLDIHSDGYTRTSGSV